MIMTIEIENSSIIWLSDRNYRSESCTNKVDSDENDVKKLILLPTHYEQGSEFSIVIYITNIPKKQESHCFRNAIIKNMVQYLEIQG